MRTHGVDGVLRLFLFAVGLELPACWAVSLAVVDVCWARSPDQLDEKALKEKKERKKKKKGYCCLVVVNVVLLFVFVVVSIAS